jgi:hypothetical protein
MLLNSLALILSLLSLLLLSFAPSSLISVFILTMFIFAFVSLRKGKNRVLIKVT